MLEVAAWVGICCILFELGYSVGYADAPFIRYAPPSAAPEPEPEPAP